jgi:hypothetical protein
MHGTQSATGGGHERGEAFWLLRLRWKGTYYSALSANEMADELSDNKGSISSVHSSWMTSANLGENMKSGSLVSLLWFMMYSQLACDKLGGTDISIKTNRDKGAQGMSALWSSVARARGLVFAEPRPRPASFRGGSSKSSTESRPAHRLPPRSRLCKGG